VPGLVHGQQGAEVGVAALAQAADLEGRGDGVRLATPLRDQASAIGGEAHAFAGRGAAFERPQRGLGQAGAQDGVQR
jgi:hypothetical protein